MADYNLNFTHLYLHKRNVLHTTLYYRLYACRCTIQGDMTQVMYLFGCYGVTPYLIDLVKME